jgi:hypothetical protein
MMKNRKSPSSIPLAQVVLLRGPLESLAATKAARDAKLGIAIKRDPNVGGGVFTIISIAPTTPFQATTALKVGMRVTSINYGTRNGLYHDHIENFRGPRSRPAGSNRTSSPRGMVLIIFCSCFVLLADFQELVYALFLCG